MPLEIFEVQLKNPHRSYFAGQIVAGSVKVKLSGKAKLIHGIKLKLTGKAKTSWKESSGRSTSHFSEEESYIDQKLYLIGYDADVPEMNLEEGSHSYPFSFQLPETLPSSFSHKYGQVKYQLEGTITRNLKTNYTCKLPFSVNGILDLNLEAEVKEPGAISNEKTICCFWCASGPLGFEFSVSKKGYVPGERVGFQFHMFNHSNRSVNCTAVSVNQEIKFIADLEHSKTKTVQICSIEGPRLNSGEIQDWIVSSDISTLRIPSIPPSRLDGCRIIKISYFIKVKMEAKDATTLKEYLPIVIGTVPLRDDFSQIAPSSSLTAGRVSEPAAGNHRSSVEESAIIREAANDEDDSELSVLLLNYPDLPPPSYEDAIYGSSADDLSCSDPPDYGSVECKSFVPKYVNYRFHQK